MALKPILRPIIAEFTSMTAIPATPTPAMEADPSLPTHIMSMVGPSILRLLLTIMGQDSSQRLRIILPFVQSLANGVPLLA